MPLIIGGSRYRAAAAPPPAGGGGAPYSLPGAGQAVAIGGTAGTTYATNTFDSIAPSTSYPTQGGLTVGNWNESVFNSYGGGTFVDDYSDLGAWVAASTGGHAHAENPGAAIFDFTDATWKLLRPADVNAQYRAAGSAYAVADTNGSPWYEINGTSEVPSPPHPYSKAAFLPSSLGGGTKGSVLLLGRDAVCNEVAGSQRLHKFDLATGQWSRVGTTSVRGGGDTGGHALWDSARSRWWTFTYGGDHNYSTVAYVDGADMTAKVTAAWSGFPPSGIAYTTAFLHNGLLVRLNGATVYVFDPDNPTLGYRTAASSGSNPINYQNVFAGWNGKFYCIDKTGGNTLVRLTPPADPISGTWVFDTVTIDTSLPAKYRAADSAPQHHTALFYVPTLDCLAWVTGGTNPVYLIRPE